MLLDCTSFGRDRSVEKISAFVQQCESQLLSLPPFSTDTDLPHSVVPNLSSGLSKASAPSLKPGSPALLMLTGNAMRAADLARGLRSLLPASTASKDARPKKRAKTEASSSKKAAAKDDDEGDEEGRPTVGKLFARHFKVSWLVPCLRCAVS